MFQHFSVTCCQSQDFQEPWLSPLLLEADVGVVIPGQRSRHCLVLLPDGGEALDALSPTSVSLAGPLPCEGVVVKRKCLKGCHVEEGFRPVPRGPGGQTRIQEMVTVAERWVWTLRKTGLKGKVSLLT